MSNTDTATQAPHAIHDVDFAHRVADIEDSVRTDIKNGDIDFLGRTLHRYVHAVDQRDAAVTRATEDVQPYEHRMAHIWDKLWGALDGDIERDETWGMFMDAIPGMPDLRIRMFEVEIPLDAITVEVEARDEDEAIELAMEKVEGEYCFSDVMQQRYIEAHEI